MASYNYASYIKEAIESVVAQSMPNWELIIVDDGSTDASLEILAAYPQKYDRIRLLQHPDRKNHGLAKTLQLGLSEARGELIAFLESDDCWTPDSLEKRLRRLLESGADVVFSHVRVIDESNSGVVGDSVLVRSIHRCFKNKKLPLRLLGTLLTRNCIPTFSCVMLKAKFLCDADFAAPVPRWLDWWLWLQVAPKGTFVYVSEVCTLWRMHNASYNRKCGLIAYLKDASVMWQGIRRLVLPMWGRLSRLERLLLKLPFVISLVMRMASIVSTVGPVNFIRRTVTKFSGL
jgi:glycosyltransferase involved in cell wall biosynthesis